MFNNSKYTDWYFKLVEKARVRNLQRNTNHRHHVIPLSLNGPDTFDNIVVLTPREHFIAHLLLVKMTSGKAKSKMAFALKRFGGKNTSRTFSLASKLISESLSGEGNPMFGKNLTEEHKRKISGDRHGMFGKYCKDLWVERYGLDEANRLDSEMRSKRSRTLSGEKNPMYGTTWSEERKADHISKMSGSNHINFGKPAFNKGRIWINNGRESKMILSTELNKHAGWVKGRLPKQIKTSS